jgi:hypothetical protein
LQKAGLQQGWTQPRAWTKLQRLANSSSKAPVLMLSYGLIVADMAAFTAQLDAQTATVTLPGTELQLQFKFNGVQVRLFELSGVHGIGPGHWSEAMRQLGIRCCQLTGQGTRQARRTRMLCGWPWQ